jgi:hypothetical protein
MKVQMKYDHYCQIQHTSMECDNISHKLTNKCLLHDTQQKRVYVCERCKLNNEPPLDTSFMG